MYVALCVRARRTPDTASKISAEKLIKTNPLLDDSLVAGLTSGYKVRSLASLSLTDLCMLHIAFDKADNDGSGELDNEEFVRAFLPLLASGAGDVSLLFMRIDANCDGTVSWEEFLTYILSQVGQGCLLCYLAQLQSITCLAPVTFPCTSCHLSGTMHLRLWFSRLAFVFHGCEGQH